MINPLLAKLETIAELSADDRRAVEAICADRRTIASQKDLVREGEQPQFIYVLLEGWAARYNALPDGSRQISAFVLPGDFCDLGATVLERMDHSIVALTPVKVAYVSRALFGQLTRGRPGLVHALRWATLVDEAVLRAWIVNLGRCDARARIAHLMCELHARMKRIGLVRDGLFDLPLTQEQLADALGLTAVHVNRVLQRLRADGLIMLQSRSLTLLDADRLRSAAGFDPNYLHARAA